MRVSRGPNLQQNLPAVLCELQCFSDITFFTYERWAAPSKLYWYSFMQFIQIAIQIYFALIVFLLRYETYSAYNI